MDSKNRLIALLLSAFALTGANAQTVRQTMYIDLGENNVAGRGSMTEGADVNGHYWNNVTSVGSTLNWCVGTTTALVNAANKPTGYQLVMSSLFKTNGMSGGGGLQQPSKELLGDMAVATATQDYVFMEYYVDNNVVIFKNLDKAKGYRFYTFGSRISDAERTGVFTFSGDNSWTGSHQMSGKGIGANGYNGNNKDILVSDIVFPDAYGRITLTLHKKFSNGMVHINAMKIEEVDGAVNPNKSLRLEQKMYLDFGETANDTRGHQTLGADANGNYWNNLSSGSSGSNRIEKGTTVKLVNASNEPSGITAVVEHMMETNGLNNGGLNKPSATDLFDLAVPTATEDYAFSMDNEPRPIRLTGLDPQHCYRFYIVGSRATGQDDYRSSIYTVSGQTEWQGISVTSGHHVGGRDVHGNVRNIAISDYVYPSLDGTITLSMRRNSAMSSNFAHVNVVKIEEYAGGIRPEEPLRMQTMHLSGTAAEGGADVEMHELRPSGASTGVFEAYLKMGVGTFTFKGLSDQNRQVELGKGSSDGIFVKDGAAFSSDKEQLVRVRVDVKAGTVSITPVQLYVKGSIVPANTRVEYAGKGVWKSVVDLNKEGNVEFTNNYIYFAFNNDDNLSVKRLAGSRTAVGMPSEGFGADNIMLCNGSYEVTLDMNRYTFALDAQIDEFKISQFGSSVSNGEGATDHHGYAYLYNQNLQRRSKTGVSEHPFWVSEISIGGNTTNSLLERYDDLTHNFARYVVFGLSLGNEGIHGSSNQQAVFNQFRDNMLKLIDKARQDGKIPVVINNYTRGDYTASDYAYVKQMNLLIHEWDVPSVNVLGAIDDGKGRWATGYQRDGDAFHPNTMGHQEFFYAWTPSLFDAIYSGKPQPVRDMTKSMVLDKRSTLRFAGEKTVHPFTVSVRVKGGEAGTVFSFLHGLSKRVGKVEVDSEGHVVYTSPADGTTVVSPSVINDGKWHTITLSHYYAQKRTLLFVDRGVKEKSERLLLDSVTVGDNMSDVSREYSELFFWRSALSSTEVTALVAGKMLKSSLEIYAPLAEEAKNSLANLAQSMNKVEYVDASTTGIGAVKEAAKASFRIEGGTKAMTIATSAATTVSIVAADGRTVYHGLVDGTRTLSGLMAGLYLVNGTKVMVK